MIQDRPFRWLDSQPRALVAFAADATRTWFMKGEGTFPAFENAAPNARGVPSIERDLGKSHPALAFRQARYDGAQA
jgi:hypothetical protein